MSAPAGAAPRARTAIAIANPTYLARMSLRPFRERKATLCGTRVAARASFAPCSPRDAWVPRVGVRLRWRNRATPNSITEGDRRRAALRGAGRRPHSCARFGRDRASFATPLGDADVERRSYPVQTWEDRRSTGRPGATRVEIDRRYVAGEPPMRVLSGSGITGRASAQKIISPPTTSIARPVHRLTLTPAALFLTSSLPTMPTTVEDHAVEEEDAADDAADVEAVGDPRRPDLLLVGGAGGGRLRPADGCCCSVMAALS